MICWKEGILLQPLSYQNADKHLIAAIPELAVPYTRCIGNGEDEHPGQYIVFESVFTDFIEILLALPASIRRDALLRRAFAFVDVMQESDERDVRDLVNITIFEGRSAWWFARAGTLIGPASQLFLDKWQTDWRDQALVSAALDPERDIIDIEGVREAVFQAVRGKRTRLSDIPGISAPQPWLRLDSLPAARQHRDGVVFLSCFGTSDPYVIAPAAQVDCDEAMLIQLVRDLADFVEKQPDQREMTKCACYAIQLGERIWRMRVGDNEHARYRGLLWIASQFIDGGLERSVQGVLSGEQCTLNER